MILARKQKAIAFILIFMMMLASFWWLAPGNAFAQPAVKAKIPGAVALAPFLGGLAGQALTIGALVLFIRMIASWAVGAAAGAMNMAFSWNAQNILNNAITGQLLYPFWSIMRDVANAFLILILLWIAFGVIFNLEKINAKRQIVRLIIVGLFINFSFTIVATVFGLANALAKPFADQVVKIDAGAKLLEITSLHTTLQASGDKRIIDQYDKALKEAQGLSLSGANPIAENYPEGLETAGEVAYGVVPQAQENSGNTPLTKKAEADGLPTDILQVASFACPGIATPLAIPAGILCAIGVGSVFIENFVKPFQQNFVAGKTSNSLGNTVITTVVNPFTGTLFLIVGAFVFASLAIVFMARGIVIMFLTIFAPLAFLAAIIPGQEKHWKTWLEKLLNWSIFAPIAYFMILFTFKTGDLLMARTPEAFRITELQANPPMMFQFALIMGMLLGTLIIAKQMGIKIAGTLMSMGEKWAWTGFGMAKGFALGRARDLVYPRLGAAAEGLSQRIAGSDTIAGSSVLRGMMAIPGGMLRRTAQLGAGQIAAHEKEASSMTPTEIQRELALNRLMPETRRTALVRRLQKEGYTAPIEGIKGYDSYDEQRRAVTQERSLGRDHLALLRSNPTIAEPEDFDREDLNKRLTDARNVIKQQYQIFDGDDLSADLQKTLDKLAAQRAAWEMVTPRNLAEMDYAALDDKKLLLNRAEHGVDLSQGSFMKNSILEVSKAPHLATVMREKPKVGTKLRDHLATPEGGKVISKMDVGAVRYVISNAGQAGGWKLPEGAKLPDALLKEELTKLGGSLEEVADKIEETNTRLANLEREAEAARRIASTAGATQVDRDTATQISARTAERRADMMVDLGNLNRQKGKLEGAIKRVNTDLGNTPAGAPTVT